MTDQIYTDRHLDLARVTKLDDGVLFDSGWGFGPTAEQRAHLKLYHQYFVETGRGNQITGMATVLTVPDGFLVDQWLWRKSDQDLDREHAEFVDRLHREREAEWEQHREDWAAREAKLPHPLRRRLERFRANGGHDFETDGWGYELVVCELAALYAASGGVDTEEIEAYARLHGTSGNQHGMAKALGQALATGEIEAEDAVANAPSALSPITGDADYSGASR